MTQQARPRLTAQDRVFAHLLEREWVHNSLNMQGVFTVECRRAGKLVWREIAKNIVTTEGRNDLLTNYLTGSSWSQVGPYFSIISSVSFSAVAAGDTAAQINGTNGWKEAGNGSNYPLWDTPASNARQSGTWGTASAGARSLSSPVAFTIGPTGGTAQGAHVVLGSGAVTTNANTSGKLFSAAAFGTPKAVSDNDVLNVSYTLTLTSS